MVVLIVIILGFVAFGVDVGYMCLLRTGYQQAADSGALAGTSYLSRGTAPATQAARNFAQRNLTESLADSDIQIESGHWNEASRRFEASVSPYDALRVTLASDDQPTFFGRVWGQQTFRTSASAVAAMYPRDIILVLDFSGSMNSHSKVDQLKEAVTMFLDILDQTRDIDRVGFVKYSTSGELTVPLTHNLGQVDRAVQKEKANGWTNIGMGMELAREEFERNARPKARKMMVLMTDGHVNRPANRDPRQYVLDEAQRARDEKIDIVAISFSSDADKSLMQQVADVADGIFFNVEGSVAEQEKELRAVFEKIAHHRPVTLVQ